MHQETSPRWAGCVIRREAQVDSTNRVARQWAREGAPHGAVVIAGTQTAGRGRSGRQWESAPGLGLWLSVIVRPKVDVSQWPLLAFAAALATADAIKTAYAETMEIKWPNDLLLSGRKLVGILIEKEGDAAIVGIGVNVAHHAEDFPPELRETATSLEASVGIGILEADILAALEVRVDAWDFLDEYRARCVTLGRAVRVIEVAGEFQGVAEAVDDAGALLVRDEQGTLRRVLAGDVSIRGGTRNV